MSRLLRLAFVCLMAVSVGCSGPKPVPPPPTADVKGQVKLDGKPLPDGEISFSLAGEIPHLLPIKDGAFSGKAYVGKARVEIRAFKAAEPVIMDGKVVNEGSKENTLPAQYNASSTLTADVSAAGPNDFTFEVTAN